jgi:hypothetical protein
MELRKRILVSSAFIAMLAFVPVTAQDDTVTGQGSGVSAATPPEATAQPENAANSNMEFKIHGWGSFELGQLYNGHGPQDHEFQHIWRQRVYGNIEAEMIIDKIYHMYVSPEVELYYPYPINKTDPIGRDLKANFAVYPNEAYFGMKLGDIKGPCLSINIGYFKYKYNPEVRDLGEYMFRSEAYPDYVYNIFDQAFARLLGVQVSANLFDSLWHQDLILNSQTFFYPRQDFSLSYLTSVNLFGGFLNIGGGVSYDHLFAVDEGATTLHDAATNMYQKNRRPVIKLDTLTNLYDTTIAFDSTYYSFRGIKLMGRFCLDPKAFFRGVKIFGPEDLRIYGEAIVLGMQNFKNEDPDTSILKHPYENIAQRIPFMFGFNFPGFNIVDVISLETQFWNNPFANEFYMVRRAYVPQHYNANGWGPDNNENMKWSVYIKKRFMQHFSATLAFARDNVFDLDETDYAPNIDFEETYRYHKDWYWRFKVEGEF